jgi:hypothetical protein
MSGANIEHEYKNILYSILESKPAQELLVVQGIRMARSLSLPLSNTCVIRFLRRVRMQVTNLLIAARTLTTKHMM